MRWKILVGMPSDLLLLYGTFFVKLLIVKIRERVSRSRSCVVVFAEAVNRESDFGSGITELDVRSKPQGGITYTAKARRRTNIRDDKCERSRLSRTILNDFRVEEEEEDEKHHHHQQEGEQQRPE